ncbi:hypothetical protein V499_00443 [Pseudogymnoascus sp. VKM F-103]|uniref:Dihydrofolate reductase n=1 Tax=Pseudogymnoascus verrucosus TaxID=342668 RepID=A0A1B8GUK0_9PEZI|nr:dihydrofolate reductase [Pseudogymnoascus verrucosus]KFY80735.1 hypothetical protein V499_00443 [Pseudogymnoascus sp. VKM F-103]OBT99524.1 dihydrofolate reductase [Pseudogymnoascus verrucosus]
MTSETMVPKELTIIVATTARNMGIGRAGELPWTGLRKEMAYFARVTKRTPLAATPNPEPPKPVRNAVIMGRKTWDSIPLKFRPLKGRVNIVLSRSHTTPKPLPEIDTDEEPLRAASLSDALKALEASNEIGKVFVIGGAEIYRMAIQEQATKRILVTKILSDFDCDTFFPISLPGDDGQWTKKGKEELDAWVGEDVAPGEQEENGIKYVFEMYERE